MYLKEALSFLFCHTSSVISHQPNPNCDVKIASRSKIKKFKQQHNKHGFQTDTIRERSAEQEETILRSPAEIKVDNSESCSGAGGC